MEEIFEMEIDAKKHETQLEQLDQYLLAIQQNTEEILKRRAELDRNKAETRAIIDQIRFEPLRKAA